MNTCSGNTCQSCSQLARTNQKYQYLMASLTHEVRNPLTLIHSSLQLIEQSYPHLSATTLWGQLKQDVSDTIHLLHDLSSPDFSDTASRQSIDSAVFLEKLAFSCRAYMNTQNVLLSTDFAPDLPIISCNKSQLKEALLNLLLNACDAASENPNGGAVLLRAYTADNQIFFHVRDNGPGIPEEHRSSIFRAFETHKASGTGIGLSVIKQVAEAHGGNILLDTNCVLPDTYTDFCICLPLA